MPYPTSRPRRLRHSPILRSAVGETRVFPDRLIQPAFVVPGSGIKDEIPSMPGQYRYSIDNLVEFARRLLEVGIDKFLLFGIPESKDDIGTGAYHEHGIVQEAIRKLKKELGQRIYVIADVCLCEYTDHGHCGIIADGDVDNDATLPLLAATAVTLARAGADMIAPSDMMDGRVGAIRAALDDHGFTDVPILSYAVKYASSFYGPFRDAADSAPRFGDRRSYQMDPANSREAFREAELDLAEGADLIMVKPGLPYLDVIARLRDSIQAPIVTYQVSGEYAMIEAAAEKGWVDKDRIVDEAMLSFFRAGCDLVITYYAESYAQRQAR